MLHRLTASTSRRRLVPSAVVACLTVGALLGFATSAQAAHNLVTGFADPAYRSTDPAERATAFDRTVTEDAGIVRIDVLWEHVVGDTPPANPTDPSDPAYDFSTIDAAVQDAKAHGLDVLFTVYHAPAWAEGPNRPPVNDDLAPAGSWDPNPGDFGKFATALATRYSGDFIPAGASSPLPEVRNFEVWNEENLWAYLSLQYDGTKQASVNTYRSLLNSFYDAVHKVNSKANVLIGGNAPYGDPTNSQPILRTRPLLFLRKLFCLTKGLKPTSCPNPARFDTLGVHPINLSGGPTRSAIDPDDASSADVPKIAKVLHAAEHNNTVDGDHHPIWATEFWWESYPDGGAKAIPGLQKHGIWIEQAMYLFWKAGVDVAINLTVADSPATTPEELRSTYQAGVLLADGTPKPAATSFRFPFVLDRESKSKVFVWGKSPEKGKLTIEKQQGGGWKKVDSLNVKNNKVFTTTINAHGKGKYRATVGDQTSLVWTLRK